MPNLTAHAHHVTVIVIPDTLEIREQADDLVRLMEDIWHSKSAFDMIDAFKRIIRVTEAQCRGERLALSPGHELLVEAKLSWLPSHDHCQPIPRKL